MNKMEAEKQFKELYVDRFFKEMDKYKQRLQWDIFTDGLCKSGEITDKQYSNWSRPNFIK
jgi:hypothetical protein